MKFSDTTQEYYRKISKNDLAATKKLLVANYRKYHAFCEAEDTAQAKEYIDDELSEEDKAYAWASRLGTLTETETDLEHYSLR
jgi:hypothetical protein